MKNLQGNPSRARVAYGIYPVKRPAWFKRPGQAAEEKPAPKEAEALPAGPASGGKQEVPPASPGPVEVLQVYQPFKNLEITYKPRRKKQGSTTRQDEAGEAEQELQKQSRSCRRCVRSEEEGVCI